jgi:hypothetical protein
MMNVENITVLPNVSDYGLVSKEQAGVMVDAAPLPDALKSVRQALGQISQRLGVDMSGRPADLVSSFRAAMERRQAAQPTRSDEPGMSPN